MSLVAHFAEKELAAVIAFTNGAAVKEPPTVFRLIGITSVIAAFVFVMIIVPPLVQTKVP